MAKLTINPGIDTYITDLTKLYDESEEICKRSAYMGAKIVADRCRAEIGSLPVETEKQKRENSESSSGLTGEQKRGLLSGLGISHFRKDGSFINVKIGISGHNAKNQPNIAIIRSLESGTSFRARNPVITRATNAARGAAEQAIKKQMDEEIKKRIH